MSGGKSRLRLSLFHRGRDRVEGRGEVGADQLHRRDDHNEMRAAIRPYSMAVAPLSSRRNAKIFDIYELLD
jgi:hypothetical protein